MNGYPDCDDMGLAKEHKIQVEIDAENARSLVLTYTLQHRISSTGEKMYRFSDMPNETYSTAEELYAKRGLPMSGGTVFYDRGDGLHTLVNDTPVKIELP